MENNTENKTINQSVKEVNKVENIKRINITELVKQYNMRSSDKLKMDYLKSQIKVNKYVGYGTKMFLADNIVKACCLRTVGSADKANTDKDSKGTTTANTYVYIDSCKRYLMYVYTLLKFWTNIDVQEKNFMFQYDVLDENDLIELILEMIPEKEIVTFKTILDIKQNDLMTNKYEPHAFITDKLNSVYPEISKVVMPMVEKLNEKIESLDENKIEKILTKLTSAIKRI